MQGSHDALPSSDVELGRTRSVGVHPVPAADGATAAARNDNNNSSGSVVDTPSSSAAASLSSSNSPTSHRQADSAAAVPSGSSPTPNAPIRNASISTTNSSASAGAAAPVNFQEQWQEQIDHTIKPAIHNFFFPSRRRKRQQQQHRVVVPAMDSDDDNDDIDPYHAQQLGGSDGSDDDDGVFRSSGRNENDPQRGGEGMGQSSSAGDDGSGRGPHPPQQQPQYYDDERQGKQDRRFVEHFWRTYDDIIILSLFTQLGILFRLGMATYFTFFDSVFSNDSALFENLPLNCLSCFIMGTLCSGERLMEIIATRFTPSRLQHDVVRDADDDDEEEEDDDDDDDDDNERRRSRNSVSPNSGSGTGSPGMVSPASRQSSSMSDSSPMRIESSAPGGMRRRGPAAAAATAIFSAVTAGRRHRNRGARRPKRQRTSYFHSWQPPVHLDAELREVQLLALERRIRASKCLLLFPVRKEDFDLMEHYFESGYKRKKQQQQSRIVVDGPASSLDDDDDDGDDDSSGPDRPSSYARNANDLSYDLELQVELERRGADNEDDDDDDNNNNNNNNAAEGGGGRRRDPLVHGTDHKAGGAERHVTFSSPSRLRRSKQQRDSDPDGGRRAEGSHNSDIGESPMVTVALDGSTPASPSTENAGVENSTRRDGSLATTRRGEAVTDGVNGSARDAAAPAADENLVVEEFFQDMHANVTENLSRLQRVNLADGWDVGTTPDDMSDDLMLGLRDGFCGALSSFSSWNSAMVGLMRSDRIGDAFVGYMLGIQLPIIAYRFGQHVAVYVFIWRCRFETRRDERRGYGIRLSMNEASERDSDDEGDGQNRDNAAHATVHEESSERKIPSVRAVATALFVLALVTQCTSLSFFNDPEKQQIALSLLFSPLGVLARWRLSRLNSWRPTFPLGTFTSNIVACLLSGSLGQLLAGNPGPKERIVLVSIISGFGGTLSSLAAFVVEVLAGIDPVLFRFDGFFYACSSIFWAWLVGFLFSATADWADQTTQE